MKNLKLSDLKPAPYNPRSISPGALAGLAKSIESFGDLSGIVWNKRTGHLVSGHQRLAALKEKHGDKLTIKDGVILAGTDRFPVRTVDWDSSTEKAANITANNSHIEGSFTDDLAGILESLKVELPTFEDLRLDLLLPAFIGGAVASPEEFREFGEDIKTDHCCPKCGYKWSGKAE